MQNDGILEALSFVGFLVVVAAPWLTGLVTIIKWAIEIIAPAVMQ